MILIASDHGGYELKKELELYLRGLGEKVKDLGPENGDPVDYPGFGLELAERVGRGEAERGILLCGTGIGMSIVANKVPGVRAALVYDQVSARMAREHNDANVLVLGGRTTEKHLAKEMVSTWLDARFEGGRHARRLEQIRQIDYRRQAGAAEALAQADPEIWEATLGEIRREEEGIVLIASENYAPEAVLAAQGSVFTNKYAEGYPGRRYYGGCEFVDRVETLAIERAKTLFGAEHANVQPISGSSANMAAYYALLEPRDTIMGMALDQGGHLTHGAAVSFSGRMYRVVNYGVSRETGTIDYDQVRNIARKERPRAIVAGASSYSRTIDFAAFREIADEIGAYLIVDMAHIAGLVAGGVHPSPVPYADVVTSTTHKTLRGPRGGLILCRKQYAESVDKAVFPGIQGGPFVHAIAAKAVTFREAATESFRSYAHRVVENARRLAERLASKGYRVVSGGTDTHMLLVDVTGKGLTGLDSERYLDRAGITVNKNAIPFDSRGPFVTSGIRIGTPIVTTRGMGVGEMDQIGDLITRALDARGDEALSQEIRESARALCRRFPYYARMLHLQK